MPSKYLAATPTGFRKPINIPAYIGPKTQWLLAYEISYSFKISGDEVYLFQSIRSRKLNLITKSIVQALLTHGDNGSDRTRTSKEICRPPRPHCSIRIGGQANFLGLVVVRVCRAMHLVLSHLNIF